MVHRRVLGVTFAAAAAIVAGCGGDADIVMLTNSAVLGPWQAEPFARLDAGLASAAEAGCRAQVPEASGLPVVLHDQRGDGIDTIVIAGPGGKAACQVVGDSTGKVALVTSGVASDPLTGIPDITGITIDGMSSTSGSQTGTVSDISGRAGPAIASVRILLDDGREVTASTSNGWFYAWWPGESFAVSLLGDDPTGRTVASATP